MSTVDGLEITTIEGISAQRSACGAEGMGGGERAAMRILPAGTDHAGGVAALVEAASRRDDDIDDGMAGNICRCGTYQRIRAAIKTAAKETA